MPTKVTRSARASTLGPRGRSEIGRKGGRAARSLVDEAFARARLAAFNRLRPLANAIDSSAGACTADVLESYATNGIKSAQLQISVNPTAGFAGTASTLATATVNATGGGPTPTGTVQFAVDGTNVGTPQTLVGGTVGLLIAGSNFPAPSTAYGVTYAYSGDSHYAAAESPTATYTTNAS